MPCGIEEAVEDVEEHGSDVESPAIHPIDGNPRGILRGVDGRAGVLFFVGVPAAPGDHGEGEEKDEGGFGAHGTREALNVECVAEEESAEDLGTPVEDVVEGASTGIETSGVDSVLLVGVEPVGGPEHGEEEDHEGFKSDGFIEANEFGFPGGVLHQDDSGSIRAVNIASIAEQESKDGAEEHKHDEGDVCAIRNGSSGFDVDILAKGNLEIRSGQEIEKI